MKVGSSKIEWNDFGIWRPYKMDIEVRHKLKKYDIYPRDNNFFTVRINLDTVVW